MNDTYKGENAAQELVQNPKKKRQRQALKALSSQEMRDAQPMPLPELDQDTKRRVRPGPDGRTPEQQKSGNTQDEVDTLDYIPSRHPGSPNRAAPAAVISGGYSYPAPYTVSQVPPQDRIRFPYAPMGKLFMHYPGGRNFVGSAAVIAPDVILTAGHCVFGRRDGWAESFTFVPGYDDGEAPFGTWVGDDASVLFEWHESENFEYDVGVVRLRPDDDGRQVGDVCGQLGVVFHLDPLQHWHACGYPSGAPYDGSELFDTRASYAYDSDPAAPFSPIGIGCNMTPGCSGGPWIHRFDFREAADANLINGVNSFRWRGNHDEMFSPRFGDAVKKLIAEF
ncbi:MAG: hypothetical protein AAGD08_17180 [Pseudomonadota bacterium]